MGQELIVPDSFKNSVPAKAFVNAGLNAQEDNLAAGIGQSYGVIGYKGKVWSLRYRGERHNILTKEGHPAPYIDVVILGQAQQKSKSYYKAFDAAQSEGERPICSSIDGLVPDPDVAAKQSETCALCPRNAWKLQQNGKKGKECQDYKRLAVVVMPYQTAPLFMGKPLVEPIFLRVPPASLNSLAIMGETMAGQGFHFATYVTRITFDPNEAHPKMSFRPLQGLTDQEAPVILELMKDPTVGRITTGDVVIAKDGLKPVDESPSTPAPTQTAPLPSGNTASAQPATPTTNGANTVTAPTASTTASSETIGFGGVTSLAAAREQTSQSSEQAPVQQTTADTGEPEASDEDLDARIAGLIKG